MIVGYDHLTEYIGSLEDLHLQIEPSSMDASAVMNALLRGNLVISWKAYLRGHDGTFYANLDCPVTASYGVYYQEDTANPTVLQFIAYLKEMEQMATGSPDDGRVDGRPLLW